MSVQVSKKKQIIFGLIVLIIILGIIEVAANIWWSNIQDCALEQSEIYENLSDEEKRQLCQDQYNLRKSGFDLIPNQRSDSININSLGFRGPEFSPEKPADVYRIFMMGGSTMFGAASTSDKTTIPGFLQQIVEQKFSFVEMINAGQSGMNSLSEAKKLDELASYEPDLIVVYDGWNDLRSDYPVLQTKNSWETMCQFGNKKGFDVIIILQPIAGFGNKILTEQEYINSLTGEDHNGFQLIQAKSTYEWLSEELYSLNTICTKTADFRGVFDEVSGTIYWDQGHVGDGGNAIIAKHMYELIIPIIEKNTSLLNSNLEKNNLQKSSSYNSNFIQETTSYFKTPIMINHFIENPPLTLEINNPNGKYFSLKQSGKRIFVGIDLSNEDLTDVELSNKDLSGANLSGQDLTGKDLSGTILRSADLSFTNLSGQDFSGKDLTGINFSHANLRDIDLTDVILGKKVQYFNPSNSDNLLVNIELSSEALDHMNILTDFSEADLRGSKISTKIGYNLIDFSNANFKNTQLSNNVFGLVNLSEIDLSNQVFSNVAFVNIDLSNSNFNGTNFSKVIFYKIKLDEANFQNADLDDVIFIKSNVLDANFTDAQIGNVNVRLENSTVIIPLKEFINNIG